VLFPQLLPKEEPTTLPQETEDAEMADFDPEKHRSKGNHGSSSAYEEDDEEGGGGNPRVQCAQQ